MAKFFIERTLTKRTWYKVDADDLRQARDKVRDKIGNDLYIPMDDIELVDSSSTTDFNASYRYTNNG